ncbi:MAG: ribose 5-phosphate isomerase B [Clostridia bacterium]|nr:ribose 5-phosphate isomerase B [Clostridia bacterium]
MVLSIGCDHGAYELKETIKRHLLELGHEALDFGCHSTQSTDYPPFAFEAAEAVASGRAERGIVLCTTGIGVCICANKVRGIRCALCCDVKSARLTRLHNNANMLALGAGIISKELAIEITDEWLSTEFEGGRHQRRVDLITEYENRNLKGEHK